MSNESEDDDIQCFLDVELEMLRSIYINELDVTCDEGRPTSVAIQLHPSTADNVDEQYVRMSLILNLPMEYPDVIPDIVIRNPRGLSDEKLLRITDDLFLKAEERKGGTMLFELIERAKEHLTAGNRPSCQCAICLYGFTEQDVFTKTKCYHYFHSHCLSRYVTHQTNETDSDSDAPVEHSKEPEAVKEIMCPVCRIPISFSVPDDCDFPPPASAKEDSFVITEELKQLQSEMSELYERQKTKGGIIDVEAEKTKFLLEISSVPSKTEPLQDTEASDTVQRNATEEAQDISQKKRDSNHPFSRNSKPSNYPRNNSSRGKDTNNRYQRYNRRGRDSNYVPNRNTESRNRGYHHKKSVCDPDEHSKQHSGEEQEGDSDAKNMSHTSDSVDVLEKDESKTQENSEESGIAQSMVDTNVEESFSADAAASSDAVENNYGESNRGKYQHAERTSSRPGYYKRYQNYNRNSDSYRQRQHDDNGRKSAFDESQATSFNSGRRNDKYQQNSRQGDNYHQQNSRHGDNYQQNSRQGDNYHHQNYRQGDNYHQQRNTGGYNQRFRNAENYHHQSGRRGNYHENWQREDFGATSRQNDGYRQSKQDYHRKPRYQSRYDQPRQNEREQFTPHCDEENPDFGHSKDQTQKTSPVQSNHAYSEEKSPMKQEENFDYDSGKVSKDDYFQRRPKDYQNSERRNYGSPRNKTQKEHPRFQNKHEERPRNQTDAYPDHQNSPPLFSENSISTSPGDDSLPIKAPSSPERYPKPPFRRPNGRRPVEGNKGNSFMNRRQNLTAKMQKTHISPPVAAEISSDCRRDIISPSLDQFPTTVQKGSNTPAISNADANHAVSRPPPGFAKKVVYGLPSVKPPPGFTQS